MRIDVWTDLDNVADDQLQQLAWASSVPFGATPNADLDEFRARRRGKTAIVATSEEDRVVGCAALDVSRLRLHGGSATCGRISDAGVLPTHRRRGILTQLMHRALQELRAGGVPLAALYASEAPVYGRFGFGVGAAPVAYQAELPWAGPSKPHTVELTVLPVQRARATLERVHAATMARRTGDFERSGADWDTIIEGYGRPRFAVVASDGYAIYEVAGSWDGRIPTARAKVVEVIAATPGLEAELWRFCLSLDLVVAVETQSLPVNHPLPLLVVDRDHVTPRLAKPLYINVLDVPTAVQSRVSDGPDATLTAEVVAPTGGSQSWCFVTRDGQLTVHPGGSPDLVLPMSALSGAILGQTDEASLAMGCDAVEVSSGALRTFADIFATRNAPCPTLAF